MHNHSYENEFNLHVNEISFYVKGWAPRLALRKRFKEIRKWPIAITLCYRLVLSFLYFSLFSYYYISNLPRNSFSFLTSLASTLSVSLSTTKRESFACCIDGDLAFSYDCDNYLDWASHLATGQLIKLSISLFSYFHAQQVCRKCLAKFYYITNWSNIGLQWVPFKRL